MKGSLFALVCLIGVALAASPRLPRTSADQRSIRNVSASGNNATGNTLSANGPRSSQRNREQYLFNVFEVIVSTLESKLQRIENLDKAVEHLMRRVEALDSRVTDNIDKTDAVITKLRTLDLKLFSGQGSGPMLTPETIYATRVSPNESEMKHGSVTTIRLIEPQIDDQVDQVGQQDQVEAADELPRSLPVQGETLGEKLLSLDQKVSDIDNKLVDLKNQLDSNFLQSDDINAEASEKKPVSMSVIEITKAMSNEVMNHVTIEIENLRQTNANMDRKFQFHMNLVAENLGTLYNMITDIHEALVGRTNEATTATLPGEGILKQKLNFTKASLPNDTSFKHSKLDRLVEHMYPMLTVSEKMDQVWNILVGTKSSIDDLLPKSDELLNQTQRQERAINEIHADLRSKTNKIIENLEGVESRLKKQENDVTSFAQRPISAELLLDPTIDRLIEYDPNRYDEIKTEEFSTEPSITTSSSSASSSISSSTGTMPGIVTPGLTLGSAGTLSAGLTLSSHAGATSTIMNVTPTTAPTTASAATASASAIATATATATTTTTPTTTTASPSSWNFSGNVSGGVSTTTPSTLNTTGFQRNANKSRGVIFPSVKNKPSPANSTFVSDVFLNLRDVKGYSCIDLLNAGMRESGVYYLQIRGTTYWFLKVYCEQDIADGGWTVIQRRDDFGEPRENFNRDWADYKNGFGDPAREFWLGNENIYMLTNNEDYMLRVELEDFEGNKRYAQYNHFKIYSEAEYYKLEIDGYDGNAGDSLNDPWYGSNNSPFSTYNRDNDRSSLNCASMLKGGWWWKSCGRGLNGLYLNDPQDLTARQGIVWFRWRGWDYTLKRAIMMIKPKGPSTSSTTNF